MRYETTSVRSTPFGLRAGRTARGAAFARRLHSAPLPGPARQRPGPVALRHRRCPGLLVAVGPQRPPRLRRRWTGLLASAVQEAQNAPRGLAPTARRRPARPAAPVAARLRPADQSV